MAFESEAVRHSRLLRPYNVKRLDTALFQVQASAGFIGNMKMKLLIDPPVRPEEWQHALELIRNELWVLSEACGLADARLELLVRSAPVDYERAVDAMHKILLGINAESVAEAA